MLYFRKSNTQSSFELVAQTEGPFFSLFIMVFHPTFFLCDKEQIVFTKDIY